LTSAAVCSLCTDVPQRARSSLKCFPAGKLRRTAGVELVGRSGAAGPAGGRGAVAPNLTRPTDPAPDWNQTRVLAVRTFAVTIRETSANDCAGAVVAAAAADLELARVCVCVWICSIQSTRTDRPTDERGVAWRERCPASRDRRKLVLLDACPSDTFCAAFRLAVEVRSLGRFRLEDVPSPTSPS